MALSHLSDLGPQGQTMSDKVRIALDAMGGDNGPAVIVAGAELALARHPNSEFLFFGDSAVVGPLIDARPKLKSASRLVHSEVVVRMEDKPSQALRYGRWKSSMWLPTPPPTTPPTPHPWCVAAHAR